jgi:hypothetical protein
MNEWSLRKCAHVDALHPPAPEARLRLLRRDDDVPPAAELLGQRRVPDAVDVLHPREHLRRDLGRRREERLPAAGGQELLRVGREQARGVVREADGVERAARKEKTA